VIPGYIKLPDGPNIMKAENVVKFMKANPGWVYKHQDWVRQSGTMVGKQKVKDLAGLAGYTMAKDGTLIQWEGGSAGARGKMLKTWLPASSGNATPKAAATLANNPDKPAVYVNGKKVNPKTGVAPGTAGTTNRSAAVPTSQAPADTSTGAGTGAGTGTGTGSVSSPVVDTSAIDALHPDVHKMIDTALANSGAKLYNPGTADAMAGLGYDSQIQSLRDSIAKNPLDTAQHQKDIGSWYGQTLAALKTAGQRDSAIQQAGIKETGDNTQAIISALGGSANAGSSLVGAAGAQAQGTMGALGQAQDQYNQDLAPILQAEKAAQMTREGARGSSDLHDLQLKVAAALGERGQAKADAQLKIDQANNGILDNRASRLIDILKTNDASRQGNFANESSIAFTKAGLSSTGAQLENRRQIELLKQQGRIIAAGQKGGPKPWASTPASQKTYAYKNLVGHLKQNADAYNKDPNALKQFIQGFLGHNGWSYSNPNVSSWVQNAYGEAGIKQ
jgi:hypothetical protein